MTEPDRNRTSSSNSDRAPYALATGSAAVRRLHALHGLYSPFARGVLTDAGLKAGMNVADFGCGIGMTTRMLAEMVGPSGSVTGVDFSAAQVQEAKDISAHEGIGNVVFVEANACGTGLPRASFDLAYCRFLLLHLTDPAACIQEMLAILKPGGILVLEDGDLTSAISEPPSALDAFVDLFGRLGPRIGLDYSMAKNLPGLVEAAGVQDARVVHHQPANLTYEERHLGKWTVEEAGPAFVKTGLITAEELANILLEMQEAIDSPEITIYPPRMYLVFCAKA